MEYKGKAKGELLKYTLSKPYVKIVDELKTESMKKFDLK
jgi:hypothetical protein